MSDPRFARLKSDPRFRRPKKHANKVVVDERFKSVFEGPKQNKKKKGAKTARVDKYGRALSDTHDEDNLRRFYRLENDEAEAPKGPDYARGEVLMQSSDEEDEDAEIKSQDGDSDTGGFVTVGHDPSRPIPVEEEIDLDESQFADLDAQAAEYDKSHPEAPVIEGNKTSRLAIVNLDWDHVRAIHLFKICSSLVSPTAPAKASSSSRPNADKKQRGGANNVARGQVLSVRVYPSQFGKERMAREDREGPPPELFRKKPMDEEEINEKNIYEVGDADEYDEDALRKYQLERLRYYYAIVTCDSVEAATHVYEELEGTELERSANVFDISFVPEDMTFDEEPRDEAAEEDSSTNYKAVEFVTDASIPRCIESDLLSYGPLPQALRHSKVKLTWDEDDPERAQVTRRIFSQKEIKEEDYKAYLASSSSESEAEDENAGKKDRKAASRNKLRALLLGGDNELPEGWDKGGDDDSDVDMEVTFAPALSAKKGDEDETTLEKYQRKRKEKRKSRKDQAKKTKESEVSEQEGSDEEGGKDGFFDVASDEEEEREPRKSSSKSKDKKGSTKSASSTDELALLVSSDQAGNEPQHFNLKAVMKAERKKGKGKDKKRKARDDENELQEDFEIDVADDRFKALHEDHQFAIDPTNPHFKKTKSMQKLLDARSTHRKKGSSKSDNGSKDESLQNLVESIKKKSASTQSTSTGKRRKLQ
ncbi:hypothetical protein K435DRAFT_959788 [Dendrothele bispora CBS 962.96]|uniref:Uncharacterized protein n=1 Tax=Dendrothele bispora (strain CBS 962.96) TaxID=1314807 RepID=A0A4V4HIR6_DENBC|nr:hypothetical protein K435DRAFT_959788 [Dendrothele bispora CBS 962.96]